MLTELLHKALDGDLTSEEREALDAALQQPDVRAQFERLRRAHDALLMLPPIEPPRGLARDIAREISLRSALSVPPPAMPHSVAARLAARIAEESHEDVARALQDLPRLTPPVSVAPALSARIHRAARHNPAPLVLVGGLVAAFALLTASFAWPNLTVGAVVLQDLLTHLSPLVFMGFLLLLVTSALIAWRPTPDVQRGGSLAFVLAFGLMAPSMIDLFSGQANRNVIRLGGDVVVNRPVSGNVIALGGNVILRENARVSGEAVAFLGDVRQERGATVTGRTSALLGEVTGGNVQRTLSTRPLPALGTASAFQPLLSWMSGAAWPRIYLAALAALTLLMFLGGVAPKLARRQRHALLPTLALGTLVFGLLIPPLVFGAISGFLVPAFVGGVILLLALSVGLCVSLYDAGLALIRRLHVPHADALGALIGLVAFAATLSVPPLAFAVWVIGGCWGAGALLLARPILLQDK